MHIQLKKSILINRQNHQEQDLQELEKIKVNVQEDYLDV